jgi:acetyl esterase/lipase
MLTELECFRMPEDILSKPAPPADARIAYGPDPNQFLDLRLPTGRKPPHPVLINIHGGYWRAKYNLEHAGHLCAALTAQGLATVNLEYRRVGNEGGGWPGSFSDIRSAYQFVLQNAHKHNLDASKVVVMGHSAGGQLALCLAAHQPDVSAVISLAGVIDLRRAYELHLSSDAVVEFLGGTPPEVPEHYREADPMQLSILHARQFLIQGMADHDVPPAFSRDYVAAKRKLHGSKKEDVHLLEIVGADHFDLIDPSSVAFQRVRQTVQELSR